MDTFEFGSVVIAGLLIFGLVTGGYLAEKGWLSLDGGYIMFLIFTALAVFLIWAYDWANRYR